MRDPKPQQEMFTYDRLLQIPRSFCKLPSASGVPKFCSRPLRSVRSLQRNFPLDKLPNGRLGERLSVTEGRDAARLAALNGLAVARAALGSLNRIRRLVRLTVHISATQDFGEHARVADGASELLAAVFKDGGGHARLAVGASSLPAHMPVELELIFELQ